MRLLDMLRGKGHDDDAHEHEEQPEVIAPPQPVSTPESREELRDAKQTLARRMTRADAALRQVMADADAAMLGRYAGPERRRRTAQHSPERRNGYGPDPRSHR